MICDTLAGFQTVLTKTFDPVSSSREKAQEERQGRQQERRRQRWSSCQLLSTKKPQTVSQTQVSKPVPRALTKVKLNSVHDLEVLIDSGADESLMEWGLAKKFGRDWRASH